MLGEGNAEGDVAYWDGANWVPMADYKKIINRLLGVLATASGWDTTPTNLANVTDGNWDNETGLGVLNGVDLAYLTFDMGGTYTVNVVLKMSATSQGD